MEYTIDGQTIFDRRTGPDRPWRSWFDPARGGSKMATCQSEKVLNENGVFVDKIQLYRDTIAMRLRREGYNVSSVEPWGGCVRAFVTMPDGSTKNQFFDPDTLEPVN